MRNTSRLNHLAEISTEVSRFHHHLGFIVISKEKFAKLESDRPGHWQQPGH